LLLWTSVIPDGNAERFGKTGMIPKPPTGDQQKSLVAVTESAKKNQRHCEERSDAATSNRLLRCGTAALLKCREVATPFGLAMTSVLSDDYFCPWVCATTPNQD
jgi:hypothetical protein